VPLPVGVPAVSISASVLFGSGVASWEVSFSF
jgi:hypothetical protein